MRKVGIVASGATETDAGVVLNEGEERLVKTEDLVLISNKCGNKVLAVCRGGLGSNENLRTGSYSPGVAYARMGRHPSSAKEFYQFGLSVIGDVTGELAQNKLILGPCSDVEVFEDEDNPMRYLGSGEFTIGFYKEHPNWKVPINEKFIPYHIGIFGVTGAGKSFLARYQVIPLLNKAGYDVVIFDWKGSDYAPYFKNRVLLNDISLDEDVVTSYLADAMDYFGFTGEKKLANPIVAAIEDVLFKGEWRKIEPDQLKLFLEAKVREVIASENRDTRGNLSQWGRLYLTKFERGLAKLTKRDFEYVRGEMSHEEILALAREKHVLVLDVSQGSKEEKLSVFMSFARYLRRRMEQKEKLNLALLIDEGPQYCPFKPMGIEQDTTEMISDLCALGRTYSLSIILLSQGIAGEIGINAAVRRNLNTQFIGKIHPLDMEEASKLLLQLNIDPKFLVSLPEGHFYFLGKMNPSPIPLLMSFLLE